MDKKKINVGLIGYKFMGKAHSHAYASVGRFFKISAIPVMKAICGRDKDAIKDAAQTYGWEGYETSWEKLVKRKDIDLIDISAPSDVHKDICIAAAEARKDIFCEKPLALTLKDALEMLKAVEKTGVKHMIGFNYRMTPAVRLAKRLIDEDRIGKIFHFRAYFLQDWLVNPKFPLVWRLRKEIAGSGAHGDMGGHLIDMARYLVGEFDEVIGMNQTFIKERPLPKEVLTGITAQAGEGRGSVTVDDATAFLAKFKNSVFGTFETTRFATGRRSKNGFEINGSKGCIAFNFEDMNHLQFYSLDDSEHIRGFRNIIVTEACHPYMNAWWPPGHIIGYEHTFIHEVYELMEALANDRIPVPNFIDGVKCQEVLDAVDESIKKKRWVQLK